MSSIDAIWAKIKDPQARSLVEAMGIEFQMIDPQEMRASMPVNENTIQYFGMLHGGASVALAETLASVGALTHLNMNESIGVGLEINANHLRPVGLGKKVFGVGKPVHIGSKTQVWSIEIRDEANKLVCISRCTMAIVPRK